MTAGQAVALGTDGFNTWIDAQIASPRKRRAQRLSRQRHRAHMSKTWIIRQPAIVAYRYALQSELMKNVEIVGLVAGVILLWRVLTR